MTLKPRGRALRWHTRHRNLREDPAESNTDHRPDGIRAAQIRCAGGGNWLVGEPWCGVWAFAGLEAAGVQHLTSRLASVALIEDDARVGRGPFRDWVTTADRKWRRKVRRGDLVVLFGRGVHVATVRSTWQARLGYIRTEEGNTSAEGGTGSQSNGGQSASRRRRLSDIYGFALVDYPEK